MSIVGFLGRLDIPQTVEPEFCAFYGRIAHRGAFEEVILDDEPRSLRSSIGDPKMRPLPPLTGPEAAGTRA